MQEICDKPPLLCIKAIRSVCPDAGLTYSLHWLFEARTLLAQARASSTKHALDTASMLRLKGVARMTRTKLDARAPLRDTEAERGGRDAL
jgi:hypothetical protein